MATLTTARLRAIAIFTLTCLLFSVSGAIFVNAYDQKKVLETEREVVTLRYQYTGDDSADLYNLGEWELLDPDDSATCNNIPQLPCVVQFENTEYQNIQAFLDAHPTLPDIMDADELISTKSSL